MQHTKLLIACRELISELMFDSGLDAGIDFNGRIIDIAIVEELSAQELSELAAHMLTLQQFGSVNATRLRLRTAMLAAEVYNIAAIQPIIAQKYAKVILIVAIMAFIGLMFVATNIALIFRSVE